MRAKPLLPEEMSPEVRTVHDGVISLVTRSQGPVPMVNEQGALIGPFPPMLRFPQFGIPALNFVRSLDILTVGAAFNCRFELYAHKIMAAHFGFSQASVAALASGTRPADLAPEESIAYEVADVLAKGTSLPDELYHTALEVLGEETTAELIFLISAYAMLAMVLNGFDVPA
jgi:4-carboxymuconolactone decarboxylase